MRVSSGAYPDGQLALEGQQEIRMGKRGNQKDLTGTALHSSMGLGGPPEFLPAPHLSHYLLLSPPLSGSSFPFTLPFEVPGCSGQQVVGKEAPCEEVLREPTGPCLDACSSRVWKRALQLEEIGGEPVSDSLGSPFSKILHVRTGSRGHPSQDHPRVSLTFRHFNSDPALDTEDPQPTVSTQRPPSLLSLYQLIASTNIY